MTLHIWIWVLRFPCIVFKYIHFSFTSQDAVPENLTGSLLNAKETALNQQKSEANWTGTKRNEPFGVLRSLPNHSVLLLTSKSGTSNAKAGKELAGKNATGGAPLTGDGGVDRRREPKVSGSVRAAPCGARETRGQSVWTGFWICSGGRRHWEKAWSP